MKELNIENLKKAAKQILVDLKEDEYYFLLEKIKKILKPLNNILNDKDLENYEVMDFPFFCEVNEFCLRDDVVETVTSRENFIKNSTYKLAGQIKFPKFNEKSN